MAQLFLGVFQGGDVGQGEAAALPALGVLIMDHVHQHSPQAPTAVVQLEFTALLFMLEDVVEELAAGRAVLLRQEQGKEAVYQPAALLPPGGWRR